MTQTNVGDQDPELKNSPIADESDEELVLLREEVPEDAVCYFNNELFAHGAVVQSGSLILRCDMGIWMPVSGGDSDNA